MKEINSLIRLGYKIRVNENLAKYTTLGIGGPALGLVEISDKDELVRLLTVVKNEKITFMVIAGGSDLFVSDAGYKGLVILNKVSEIKRISQNKIQVYGGTVLGNLINYTNENGLAGLENMAGIPGSVGGALYGNAGAYGQTISDCLDELCVFKDEIVGISKKECQFSYRDSIFKRYKDRIILSAIFSLTSGKAEELIKRSKEIILKRSLKYPPDIKCPGSFFKNIPLEKLSKTILKKIPQDKINHGKIPAGYLLEEVGAKGLKIGDIEVASYHGNLFINRGKGTSKDFYDLAWKMRERVKEKFNITLEPEVQLVGFEA